MSQPPPQVDPTQFRRTLAHWASGVTIVTALTDHGPQGMTANSFSSVSLDPPLVLVCVDHRARMHQAMRGATHYGVSILAREQEAVSNHFAGRPVPLAADPFVTFEGMPVIAGALAHLVCRITDAHEAGDHTVYIAAVEHSQYQDAAAPLLYFSGKYRTVADAPPAP